MKLIDITHPLSESTVVYPGDEPFGREVTAAVANGDAANVTAFRGSAHAATHADLPAHLFEGAADLPLDAYVGPAVVLAVSDWAELAAKRIPTGMRVLFRSPDGGALPASAVEWLLGAGAVLVGVDGPSVDAADSTDLPNHRRLLSAGVAILENLDLAEVAEGEYELIALPLRIPGADATWVRAVLRAEGWR